MDAHNNRDQPYRSPLVADDSSFPSNSMELDFDDEPGPEEWDPVPSINELAQLWFPFVDPELMVELLGLEVSWKVIERYTSLNGCLATAPELETIAAIEKHLIRLVMEVPPVESSQYDLHWRRRIGEVECEFYGDVDLEILAVRLLASDEPSLASLYYRQAPLSGEPGRDPNGFYRRIETSLSLKEILDLVTQLGSMPHE